MSLQKGATSLRGWAICLQEGRRSTSTSPKRAPKHFAVVVNGKCSSHMRLARYLTATSRRCNRRCEAVYGDSQSAMGCGGGGLISWQQMAYYKDLSTFDKLNALREVPCASISDTNRTVPSLSRSTYLGFLLGQTHPNCHWRVTVPKFPSSKPG